MPDWPTVDASADAAGRAAAAARTDRDYLLVLDGERRPTGWIPVSGPGRVPGEELPVMTPMGPRNSLFEALDHMLSANASAVAVVDGEGRYRGALEMDSIRALINTARARDASGHLQEV